MDWCDAQRRAGRAELSVGHHKGTDSDYAAAHAAGAAVVTLMGLSGLLEGLDVGVESADHALLPFDGLQV